MKSGRCSFALVLALSVTGCAQGTPVDEDPTDARAVDARANIDAPPADIDAATVDATTTDATTTDAATTDAATTDAVTTDAVTTDAASADAPIDGGTTTAVIFANTQTELYRIDPVTYAATRVANFGWPAGVGSDAMADIAIASNGSVIGASGTRLYRCSPTTAACTLIGSLSQNINSLAYAPAGLIHAGAETLVGAKSDGTLYWIDDTNATMTSLGHYSSGHASSGDIAYGGGSLVATVNPGGTNDSLVRVNAMTGATTMVGTTSRPWVWGLAATGTTLVGFTLSREIVTINTTTGATTLVATSAADWYGAAGR